MAAGSRIVHQCLQQTIKAQWRSRFLRYIIERPNGDALRKCILKGPYTPTIVTTPAVPATEDSPAVPEQTTVETVMNITPEKRAHFESEKEAIHLILTGIGDEIYSTVDACQTAQEMWEAIETAYNKWFHVVQTLGYSVLTARNLVIMLRKCRKANTKGLKTPLITRKRCCCVNKLRKVFNLKQSNHDWLSDTDENWINKQLKHITVTVAKIQVRLSLMLGGLRHKR
ncbi:hypothetical protein Tco_1209828 [Tanacetum coccineum]